MKLFPVATVLTVTTGRLLCEMGSVYEILNFMTGDDLFTHQLPRASKECEPWIAAQYPTLMGNDPQMQVWLAELSAELQDAGKDRGRLEHVVKNWAERVRLMLKLPSEIPVHALGEGMHTRINPIDEAEAMIGNGRVLTIEVEP